MIEDLIEAGHAYVAADGSGDVYFRREELPSYGELSHQNVDDMQPAEDSDPRGKRDPATSRCGRLQAVGADHRIVARAVGPRPPRLAP